MLDKLRRLRGRSIEELRVRAWQSLSARFERARLIVEPRRSYARRSQLPPRGLLDSIASNWAGLGGRGDGARHFVQRLAADDGALLALVRARSRALVLAGRVQLLGFEPLKVSDPPDWHREPRSGVVSPRRHWSTVPYLDPAVVGDHKIIWELNRHQYLYAPALSWLLDSDDAALRLVQRHLASWLDENPPAVGVNWASSLELSFRSITWCWILWLLADAPWDEALLARLRVALELQGQHIERYLSLYFSPNTHLTGEALGLFYLGSVLRDSAHAARWRSLGADLLERALATQVHADGVYFEQSTLYQRYTVEIYLHYLRFATATGWKVSDSVPQALGALLDVLRSLVDGNGCVPLIGDDDGGQLLPLDPRSPEHMGGVLLAGAVALSRPELSLPQAREPALAYALCGIEPTDRLLAAAAVAPSWRDQHFAAGGVLVLRDGWQTEAAVATVDAGPHGALNCAHAHADALSLTLTLGARPLLIDRGTLAYAGAMRNEFRATGSHNTLEFDSESSVEPTTAFQWGPRPLRPSATLSVFEIGSASEYARIAVARAQAVGHAGSARPSMHRRVVAHVTGSAWLVLDRGTRSGSASVTLHWQLAPGLVAEADGVHGYVISDAAGTPLARMLLPMGAGLAARRREVSPRYGTAEAAVLLQARAAADGRLVTLIVPAAYPRLPPAVTLSDGPDGRMLRWVDALGGHWLRLPWGDAEAVWGVEGGSDLLIALGALESGAAERRDTVAIRSTEGWAMLRAQHPTRGSE